MSYYNDLTIKKMMYFNHMYNSTHRETKSSSKETQETPHDYRVCTCELCSKEKERISLEKTKILVEAGADIHAMDNWPLIRASDSGYLGEVKYLVGKGADIHAMDNGALRLASKWGHLEVVKYLTEKGADIHAANNDAIRAALDYDRLDVVKYLTDRGFPGMGYLDMRKRFLGF